MATDGVPCLAHFQEGCSTVRSPCPRVRP